MPPSSIAAAPLAATTGSTSTTTRKRSGANTMTIASPPLTTSTRSSGGPTTRTMYGRVRIPYFLVYVREDEAGKIVESVKREIVWPPPDSSPPALPNRNNQSQMSHMPPDTSNGAYRLSDSAGYYEVEGQKVWIGDQYSEPQPSNRVEHAQNQEDLMELDQNPSLKQELEAREYKDYQNSKPAAFKTPRL